jgi:membrane-bound lytic murein transglycosylase D
MRRIVVFFVLVIIMNASHVSGQAIKGVDVELEFKELEKRGLPIYRGIGILENIQEWLENENNATRLVAGRYAYYRDIITAEGQKVKNPWNGSPIPWFLYVLPAANTGFEPRFKGEDGASGMWPLPFRIGKKYGLTQAALYDQRRDPVASTKAALLYLLELQNIYKDWNKTITAFSIGPARLNQLIHATGSLDFDVIYQVLEPEERQPIMQFYAALICMQVLEKRGDLDKYPYLIPKTSTLASIQQNVPFQAISENLPVDLETIRELNPAYKADYIPYMGGNVFTVVLPSNVSDLFESKQDSLAFWTRKYLKKEEPKVAIGPNPIKEEEPLTYDTIIEIVDGDTLRIIEASQEVNEKLPNSNKSNVVQKTVLSKTESTNSSLNTEESGSVWVYYTIKKGDALYTITDVFDCTTQQIKSWNQIKNNNFLIAGKKLKFQVPSSKKAYYQKINTLSIQQKRNLALND